MGGKDEPRVPIRFLCSVRVDGLVDRSSRGSQELRPGAPNTPGLVSLSVSGLQAIEVRGDIATYL